MITVKAQKNLRSAKSYFEEHLGRDDYYREGKEEAGIWKGSLAEEMGLVGHVGREHFHRLASGLNPGDGTKLTQRLRSNRVSYFDFVCSAPKSVSVVAMVGGDERLIQAHRESCDATFGFLERSACVRIRKGSRVLSTDREYTSNLVGAAFDHNSSRNLDCQLHRHWCVFNVTKDKDGSLKALDARRMYEHSKAATAIYRNELAKKIINLGYHITVSEKDLVIDGVPSKVLSAYSGRSRLLTSLAEEKEASLGRKLSKKERSVLIHRNRERKVSIDKVVFQEGLLLKISPGEQKGLAELVSTARQQEKKGPGKITRNVPLNILEPKRKLRSVELYRRLLITGCGKVNSAALEKDFLRGSKSGNPERLLKPWPRGRGRTMRDLLVRGSSKSLRPILRGLVQAALEFERDIQIEVFK